MNKYEEALDIFIEYVNWLKRNGNLIHRPTNELDNKISCIQELVDKQANHEQEVQVLKATIQNKNAVISSLNKRLKAHTSHLKPHSE